MSERRPRKLKDFEFAPENPAEPRIVAFRANPVNAAPYLQPHVHRFLFLIYFERGGGWQRVGAERRDAKTGDLFLIAPGETHDGDASLLRAKAKAWVVCFTPDALDPRHSQTGAFFYLLNNPLLLPFFRSAGKGIGHVTIKREAHPAWSRRLQALEAELLRRQTGYREAARAQLTLLLVDAARLTTEAFGEIPIQKGPLLTKVFDFIDVHYAKPISSVDVAEANPPRSEPARSPHAWARRGFLNLSSKDSLARSCRHTGEESGTWLRRHSGSSSRRVGMLPQASKQHRHGEQIASTRLTSSMMPSIFAAHLSSIK